MRRAVESYGVSRPRLIQYAFYATLIGLGLILVVFFGKEEASLSLLIGGAAGLALLIITFLNTEFVIYLLILSMLLSPEFVVGGGGLAESRQVTLRLDDIILLLVFFAWFAKTAINKDLGLFLRTPLNRPMFIYSVIFLISTSLGVFLGNIRAASGYFYCLKYIEYFFVYFLVVNNLRDEAQAERYFWVAVFTCLVIAVYAIAQIPAGQRVTAPFEGAHGEPNTLGGYLLFMLAIMGGLLLNMRRPLHQFLLFSASGIMAVPLLYTLSRSSWLGMIPVVFVLFVFTRRKLTVIIAVLLAVAIIGIAMPEKVSTRFIKTFQGNENIRGTRRVGPFVLDQSASDRVMHYEEALKVWLEAPVLGHGATGGFMVDSQIIRVMMEAGAAGLLAFLYLIYRIHFQLRENYLKLESDLHRGLCLGVLAGLWGLLFHSLGASTFIIIRVMEPFWLMVAITISLPTLLPAPKVKEVEEEPDWRRFSITRMHGRHTP